MGVMLLGEANREAPVRTEPHPTGASPGAYGVNPELAKKNVLGPEGGSGDRNAHGPDREPNPAVNNEPFGP
jgi:hypothetical protein